MCENPGAGNFIHLVIPKEIRRTLRIREGDPLHTTLTSFDLFLRGIADFAQRIAGK